MKQKNKYESRHLEKCLSPFISLRSHISPFRYQPSRSFTFLSHIFAIPGERNFNWYFGYYFSPFLEQTEQTFFCFFVFILFIRCLCFELFFISFPHSFKASTKRKRVRKLLCWVFTQKNKIKYHNDSSYFRRISTGSNDPILQLGLNSDIKKHLFRIKIDLFFAVFLFCFERYMMMLRCHVVMSVIREICSKECVKNVLNSRKKKEFQDLRQNRKLWGTKTQK